MNRGFSLVESLVSLAILSAGLLAAAVLLLSGLRNQALALRQLEVSTLVADMTDRIRANISAAAHYDTRSPRVSAADCTNGSPCDGASLAARDLADFDVAMSRLLPHQRPAIAILFEPAIGPAAVDRISVSLHWRDARDPDHTDVVTLSLLAQSPVAGAA